MKQTIEIGFHLNRTQRQAVIESLSQTFKKEDLKVLTNLIGMSKKHPTVTLDSTGVLLWRKYYLIIHASETVKEQVYKISPEVYQYCDQYINSKNFREVLDRHNVKVIPNYNKQR